MQKNQKGNPNRYLVSLIKMNIRCGQFKSKEATPVFSQNTMS